MAIRGPTLSFGKQTSSPALTSNMRLTNSLSLAFGAGAIVSAQSAYPESTESPSASHTSEASPRMMSSVAPTTSMTSMEEEPMNTLSYFTTTLTTTDNGVVMTYVSSCTGEEEETPMPTPMPSTSWTEPTEEPTPPPESPMPPVRPPMSSPPSAPAPSAPPPASSMPSSPSIVPATGLATSYKVELSAAAIGVIFGLGLHLVS